MDVKGTPIERESKLLLIAIRLVFQNQMVAF